MKRYRIGRGTNIIKIVKLGLGWQNDGYDRLNTDIVVDWNGILLDSTMLANVKSTGDAGSLDPYLVKAVERGHTAIRHPRTGQAFLAARDAVQEIA